MKTAETRAADKAMDKAIYFAQLIKEIYIKSQVLRPDSSGGINNCMLLPEMIGSLSGGTAAPLVVKS